MCNETVIRRFAGTFVLLSLALGWWVHPAWFLFTAFVGVNLIQSTITGYCPLERILGAARLFGCVSRESTPLPGRTQGTSRGQPRRRGADT